MSYPGDEHEESVLDDEGLSRSELLRRGALVGAGALVLPDVARALPLTPKPKRGGTFRAH